MVTLLIAHIIIALSGIIVAGISLLTLSSRAITTSYVLTVGTIATGTVLVMVKPDSLIQGCVSGLAYVTIMLTITTVSKHKSRQTQTSYYVED